MAKQIILFLAANPLGSDRLALDQEARAIQVELERSRHRDQFELVTRWAAEPLDVLRELRKLRPTIVHFSGHAGSGITASSRVSSPSSRDVNESNDSWSAGDPESGLLLHATDGRPQLVSSAALAETFRAAGASVRLVVLNACYSDAQAETLLAYVDCVVGMHGPISDDEARSFALGFYGGLIDGESIAVSYDQGIAAISLTGICHLNRPKLKSRNSKESDPLVRLSMTVEIQRCRRCKRRL